MNSRSIPTSETPFQNNNDECVQTSAASDLTESSLDCKPSATETGILHDFDSYSMKDVVFNENEDTILAIGDVQRSKSRRIKLFEDWWRRYVLVRREKILREILM